ncbi:hypothetical protein I8751_01245 [Nostocaceae cyanobacterium CENA357]|uniref:Uncharacterized protein n=1 Tax=Atlanticothrix silvestris CENA357 TaxID=1725252 RepID=A0A8J7H5Q4_9CYAN|nr:hypothetical protein [Atlanticothrix silvestris]MBH8551037.1 hypothetical protein [Atlanticothrix silvestris CENA357]
MKTIEHSYNNNISLPLSLSQPTKVNSAIVPLQPQQEIITSEWEHLIAQAQRINQMAAELEVKILELKAIASTFNTQANGKPCKSICKYLTVSVPWVRQKPDKSLIITTRKVDLFRAEKEAALLAQKLRQQTKRKRLASQQHIKNKSMADADQLLRL